MENETQENGYVPRPAWQVWAARAGLVMFIVVLTIAGGGL